MQWCAGEPAVLPLSYSYCISLHCAQAGPLCVSNIVRLPFIFILPGGDHQGPPGRENRGNILLRRPLLPLLVGNSFSI